MSPTAQFLDLPPRLSAYDRSTFAILPIPYDATTSFLGGTRWGPRAIIDASAQIEDFDEELRMDASRAGIATLASVACDARGPEAMIQHISKAARRVVRDGKFLFGVGGEHSVSFPLAGAVAGRFKKLSVLQIDAHADLRDTYQGSSFSHACVMRRIYDEVTTDIVPVGIRSLSTAEHHFAHRAGIRLFSARECREHSTWMDEVVALLGDQVYVTIDIDGFDPAYAPGTGTPEPGGLDWYQVTRLLRLVTERRRVVGADIVEVLPVAGQVVTEFLAARLMYKLMTYVVAANRRNARTKGRKE